MNDLPSELEAWLRPLLDGLQPNQVRRLARTLAMELRRRQSARIAALKSPDGTPYVPRRANLLRQPIKGAQRRQRERVKAMFKRLRTSAHLKARFSAVEASVIIEGRSARIARVHQFGLVDRPQEGGPEVRYPTRSLLGWSPQDLEAVGRRIAMTLTPDRG